MGRKPSHIFAWALAISLALHALLIGVLGTMPPPRSDGGNQPLVVELISVPPAPPPPKPEPPKPEEKPEPPRPAPKPVQRAEVPPEPPAAEEAPPPPPEPIADVPRAVPDDVPARPSLATGLGGLSASWALSLDAGVALDDKPRGIQAPAIPGDLAADAVKRTLGRGRVDRGLVHSYYATLGKALIKNWDADRAVGAHGLKSTIEQFTENAKVWNNIWKDRASEFGKTGNPFGDDSPDLGPPRRVDDRLPGGYDLQARRATQKKMGEAFKQSKRATIRVVQDESGKLVKVELVEPSNDSHIDNEALKDVRAAAEKLPPPPVEALEGKHQLSSLWQFELIVSISPPVPTITFEFDEALGFIDARLPLDRRIYKRVRLVSVE